MTSKEHPIKILEEALKYEESQLQKCQASIETLRNHAHQDEDHVMAFIARISGLKDALHKLKGLDNLERKNIEGRRPASMEKNLLRTETAMLYGKHIASYSLRELAAYILHQSDRITELLERER